MPKQGVFVLPSLFRAGSYIVFFWSNENGEPVHVHIAEGKPSQSATKVWLTKSGGCVVANNNSRIPQRELNSLLDMISAQFFWICSEWKRYLDIDEINFYC